MTKTNFSELEWAASQHAHKLQVGDWEDKQYRDTFKSGAKWQEEQLSKKISKLILFRNFAITIFVIVVIIVGYVLKQNM